MAKTKNCFVFKNPIQGEKYELNPELSMPISKYCTGADCDKKMVEELQDSLADEFVCGCI